MALRALRIARGWLCYVVIVRLTPLRWTTSRFGLALLPHAGDWVYREYL